MSHNEDAQTMWAIATAFANDDDDDVAAAVLAAQQLGDLVLTAGEASESNPRPGSCPGKAPNKNCGLLFAESSHLHKYFGLIEQAPICDEVEFERRSRVPRVVFSPFVSCRAA